MPLDSSSTLEEWVGEFLRGLSLWEGRIQLDGPSTPAPSLLQKAAKNTIGSRAMRELECVVS